ncbi:FHA domain-containing protein [Nonomuraea sp. NN258]|uniref:FHA domain-containing protein n=1 Tax=Nonomuraea antri TaxID=2730852 RepID=UPI001569048B|nr:FHA domain-containing protein [Nonomuraea antri]NRQ30801.1 FHA domain-containing protein [Nonomuraea antri]
MPPSFELFITRPPELHGRRIPVRERPAEIGRAAELLIDSEVISRRHARIWLAGGSTWITDCGSTNGTWVNGAKVEHPVPVAVGQQVRLGGVEAILRVEGTEPQPHMPGPDANGRVHQVAEEHATTSAPIQRPTNTTRYLCAAGYIDESFGQLVIQETLGHPYRACAPAYGVDLPAVVKHALAAERHRAARDLLLLLIACATLGVLATGLSGLLPDLDGPRDAVPAVLKLGVFALVPLALAWLVTATHLFHQRVVVLGRRMSSRRFSPSRAPSPMGPETRRGIERLVRAQRGNVVVFTDYLPFAGSGYAHDRWSFAFDITKAAKKDRPPLPFHSDDVHGYLAAEISATGLPNLRLGERLFINGVDVNNAPQLLPEPLAPPVSTADPELVRAVSRAPESSARAYLSVEVLGWGGQLMVTVFIRAVRLRRSLFLEGSTFVLPPLRPEYFAVDRVSPDVRTGLAVAVSLGAARAVPLLLTAPRRVAARWARTAARRRQAREDRAVILSRGLYDYGAGLSVRELAMGDDMRRFFIARDAEMFDKVVHEAIFKGVSRFLADHNIDTGEAADRLTQIINNKTIRIGSVSGQGHNIGGSNNRSTVTNTKGGDT